MSFRSYESYCESGIEWVGKIPTDWRVEPLFAVASECDLPNTGMLESNLLSLSYGRIVRKSITDNDGLLPESFETYQVVEPGDIVWRLTDLQNDKRSLRTAIVEERGIITSAYLATRPRAVRPRYLNYLLRSYDQLKVFYSMGGGVRQTMKFSDVRRMPVLLPSEREQEAIEVFLEREVEKIEALVVEQRRLITLLKEKRRRIVADTVTKGLDSSILMKRSGIDWLEEVPAHWAVAPVGSRYEVQLGQMLNEKRASGDNMRPYLRVFDVQWDEINVEDLPLMDFSPVAQERYRLEPGDLLVNEGGSYVGRSAIWRGELSECYYQKALHRLRPRNRLGDTAEFLLFVMEMATQLGVFVYQGNQTTIDHLTAEQLRQTRLPFPPFEEQHAIARHLRQRIADLTELAVEAERSIKVLEDRRAALVFAAVSGKIDVRASLVTDRRRNTR